MASKLEQTGFDPSTATVASSMGATTDTPLAYNGDDEGATARTGISLWKRIANALKAVAASVANIPAKGAAAKAAATPVGLCTEDAAKVPALGQALAAASTPVVLPSAQETALKAVTEASASAIKTAVELIDNAVGTHDGTVSTALLAVGSKAESSTPAEVADGDDVRQWLTTFGAAVLAGYDVSANGTRVFQDSAPLRRSSDVYTLLDAVSSTQTSFAVDLAGYNSALIWIESAESDGGVNATLQVNRAIEAGDTGAPFGDALTLNAAGQRSTDLTGIMPGLVSVTLTRTTGTFTVKMKAQA